MKKSLLSLAILGAFATAAQAQVTIGGIVAANVKDYKIGNTTRHVQNEIRIDDDYTSRFWLTGTEDLGGGNAALFYIENRLNMDVSSSAGSGNGLSNGDTFLGLKGGWGQFTAGKHSMMYVQGAGTERGKDGIQALPISFYATYSVLDQINGANITTSRVQNSVMYKLPNLAGFNGSAGYSTQTADNEGTINGTTHYSSGGAAFLQGGYANGPVYVNLAYWKEYSEDRTGSDKTQARLSGSYAFPFGLKIGLQLDQAKSKNAATGAETGNRSAFNIPVSYSFGANTILASVARAGDTSVGGVKQTNTGAKFFTLGYDYALSKRTNVGVFYNKLKNDTAGAYHPFSSGSSATGSTPLAGESVSAFALGIKHTF